MNEETAAPQSANDEAVGVVDNSGTEDSAPFEAAGQDQAEGLASHETLQRSADPNQTSTAAAMTRGDGTKVVSQSTDPDQISAAAAAMMICDGTDGVSQSGVGDSATFEAAGQDQAPEEDLASHATLQRDFDAGQTFHIAELKSMGGGVVSREESQRMDTEDRKSVRNVEALIKSSGQGWDYSSSRKGRAVNSHQGAAVTSSPLNPSSNMFERVLGKSAGIVGSLARSIFFLPNIVHPLF